MARFTATRDPNAPEAPHHSAVRTKSQNQYGVVVKDKHRLLVHVLSTSFNRAGTRPARCRYETPASGANVAFWCSAQLSDHACLISVHIFL